MFEIFGGRSGLSADEATRLRRVEQKLDLILQHLGIANEARASGLPEEARISADAGDKISAIKAYRDATGAGLVEAKHAVENYIAQQRYR